MNLRKLKKRWREVIPSTKGKKIPKRLIKFYIHDQKLRNKYLNGVLSLSSYLQQRQLPSYSVSWNYVENVIDKYEKEFQKCQVDRNEKQE